MERKAALAGFEAARLQWEEAFARVPDDALHYLKPGDDYALGGLQVHVNWVLAHYMRVFRGMVAIGFGELRAQDPPLAQDARSGIDAAGRRRTRAEMARLHAEVKTALEGLHEADWTRKAPVVYAPGQEPYPTSAEDIVGWLTDHYREHVEQCAELIDEWRAAKAAG